jgi:hypothetical protein
MKLMLAATAVLAMAAVVPTAGRAAEIKLICSNGYHAVIDVLGPQYEKATRRSRRSSSRARSQPIPARCLRNRAWA